MSYITARARNNLIVEARSGLAGANIHLNHLDPGKATQLWTFEPTDAILDVFYITTKASTNVITVPPGAKNSSLPTLQPKRSGYDPAQLWKFIPTKYGVNLLIQNYSLDGNGLVLDCNDGGVGKQCHMWCRGDDNNDNQKSYMKI